MRLANGIVIDKEKTFGVLKFLSLIHILESKKKDP